MSSSILRFRKWQDRQAALLGRLLLKAALADINSESEIIKVKFTEFGRPYIVGDIDFNISHSGHYVVCALNTKGRVGIDVEEIRPLSIADFKSQFTIQEWLAITNSDDQWRVFYNYWTIKEAVSKGDGRGLNIPMIQLEPVLGSILFEGKTWFYRELCLFENCATHLAFDDNISKPDEAILKVKKLFVPGTQY